MEDLKKAIDEIQDEILKVVVSNKVNKEIEIQ